MGYDAFLSYNHKSDMEFARALEDGLEKLARPWNRVRAMSVFRDEHSLSANAGLWSSIEKPLVSARYFVLLASAASAQSIWCNREVETFLAKNPIEQVLLVVTDGVIKWDPAVEFGGAGTTCLPPALQQAFTEQPHYIDGRAFRTSGNLTLRNPEFANVVADIAAPIHGKPKDELFGDDIRQHRRVVLLRRAAIGALATLTALSIGLGTLAGVREREARDRRLEAEAARNEAQFAQALAETRRAEAQAAEALAERRRSEAESAQALAEQRRREAEAEKARALRGLFSSLKLYLAAGQPGSVCVTGLCVGAPPGDGGAWTSISRLPPVLPLYGPGPEVSRDFIASREYGAGHVLVYAHDGVTRDDEIKKGGDNLVFAENALRWLAPADSPAGCARGTTILFWQGTYLQAGEVRSVLEFIRVRGWTFVVAKPDTLEVDLRCASVLWYASDWAPPANFATRDVPLIERFVRGGGGLLVGGLGWSYADYGPSGSYAADELGKPFGFAFTLDAFVADGGKPIPLLAGR